MFSCGIKKSIDTESNENQWLSVSDDLTDFNIQSVTTNPQEPNVLYVSSFNGIYKSTNGGKSWFLSSNGLSSNDIKVLVCDPLNTNYIYAGTWGDGIFCSEDGGGSWNPMNNNITDLRIRSIVLNSHSSGNLVAASGSELLESKNRGQTWEWISKPSGRIRSIAIDFNREIIFAGTDYNGIYVSIDKGNSWQEIVNGLPKSSENYYFPSIDLKICTNPSISIWTIIDGNGVYLSQDDGRSWEARNNGLTSTTVQCFAVDNKNPYLLLLGTKQGVFISFDRGLNWQKINDGLTNLDVRAVAIDSNDSKIIYAGTMGAGIFKMILE